MEELYENQLRTLCEKVLPLNKEILSASKAHWDQIAKPLEGLGILEEMITKLAAIQNQEMPVFDKRAVVVFCSDNGVVSEGVTQTDAHVTAVVSENIANGIASVNRMAHFAGTDVIPVDVGVAETLHAPGIVDRKISFGTGNIKTEPAMSREQVLQAIHIGISLAGELKDGGFQILATGEMGIGNTTTSSAVASVLLGVPAEAVTGKGAGLSREGLRRKRQVIEEAIALHQPDPSDALTVLQTLGGYDLAAMTGLFLGGAIYQVPVVLDGMISAVAALAAKKLCPEATSYMLASHVGKEPACALILKELELEPVICARLALGEGTGAALLFPMLDMAYEVYRENETFDKLSIEAYQNFQ